MWLVAASQSGTDHMAHQVLARKWRPRTFDALVGQSTTVQALQHALERDQLHHAYLFTGTHGVGKTTVARLFAKGLTCETGITANPCGQCDTCQAIDAGRFPDLLEIDAASRTKVEDTRDLLDNVQYLPSQGRFKIYLIDEVHMLSGHSFNALLKTLEEPPEHVKFLLATTDPHKLPVTVLSRCLQFHLRNLPEEIIDKQLQHIAKTDGFTLETQAATTLAKAANGSMRDALSLCEQALAYSADAITSDNINTMLGCVSDQAIIDLLQHLADDNMEALLATSAALTEQGTQFSQVLDSLLEALHHISLSQAVPSHAKQHPSLQAFSNAFSKADVQLFYQIALHGKRDLSLAPSPRVGFEMTLLRMLAFSPEQGNAQPIEKPLAKKSPAKPVAATAVAVAAPEPEPKSAPPPPTVDNPADSEWQTLCKQLKVDGMAMSILTHCAMDQLTDTALNLTINNAHAPFLNESQLERIKTAVSTHFAKPMQVTIVPSDAGVNSIAKQENAAEAAKRAESRAEFETDPGVKSLLSTFDATIVDHS